ncbi:MAG: outer membrane beta-barrel protein [Burkholderiaceae bacterium]
MRNRALARSFAIWSAAALVPVAAWAQPIVPPAPELTNVPTDQNVLRFNAGANLEHHSNVTGLGKGVDPQPIYGKSSRSDTILRGVFGVTYDQMFSLQRLTLEARLEPAKYFSYSQFDYLGYSGRANLDWAIGNAVYGTLGVRAAQVLTSVLSNATGSRNLERRNTLYGSAGLRLTPSTSVFVGADTTKLDNSEEFFRSADNRVDGFETGLRYAPGTGTDLALVYRHQKSDYENDQLYDSLGNVLPPGVTVNNSYKQNAGLVRLTVSPSEDTRISGEFGYTKRKYDSFSQRDYSGPTALLTLAWRPSGAFYMNAELERNIASTLYLTSNYIQVTEIRLLPVIVLTGKTRLNGRFAYSQQEYKGDSGLLATSGPVRKDDVYTYGVQLAYDYSRGLAFTLDLRRLQRKSNYDGLDFSDNVIGVGVTARF